MKPYLVILLTLFSLSIFSQTYSTNSLISNYNKNGLVEGKVFDSEISNELVFATIAVKNTNIKTETNFEGSFSLSLKPNTYTLIFSFVGYKTIEVENVKITSNGLTKWNQKLEVLKIKPDLSSIKTPR